MALMLDALTHPRAVAPMTGGMVTTGAVIDIARVGFGGLLAGRLSVALVVLLGTIGAARQHDGTDAMTGSDYTPRHVAQSPETPPLQGAERRRSFGTASALTVVSAVIPGLGAGRDALAGVRARVDGGCGGGRGACRGSAPCSRGAGPCLWWRTRRGSW